MDVRTPQPAARNVSAGQASESLGTLHAHARRVGQGLPDDWKLRPSDLTDRQRVTLAIDGDTLQLERGERVRLVGIDCPELDEPLGPAVADYVRGLVEGRLVRLSFDPATVISGHRDCFDRLLAYVWLPNGRLLNREIVALGYGTADLRYPCLWTPSFLEAARAACRMGLGVWQPASPHRCVARTRGRPFTRAGRR